ncbi:MFS transporter [Arthrobacter sp. Sa2BUA2]|uniref:MFS transporter n=1 Tax=Arthrobacter pullicola TaxID=2762224 RepID=A0ABR8YE67_9MICC|nr:MFS transporter [Arthrobacter pullicola]
MISGMALIAATYGLARFGFGFFLPRFTEAFDLSPSLSGAIQAGSFLSYCVTAAAAARLGACPRLVVACAGATAALGAAGVAAAPNAGILAAGVVIAGGGAGFATPGLVRLIERNIAAARQESAQTVVNAGTGAGIVAAGVLLILTAGQWRLGWAGIAVLSALSAAAVLRSDRSSPGPAEGESGTADPPRLRFGRLAALAKPLGKPLAAALLAGASSAAVWTFGRTVIAGAGSGTQMHSVTAWMVLGAFGVLGAFAGKLVQAASVRTAWTGTVLAMAAATFLLGVAPGTPVAAFAAAALFGGGYTAMSGVLIVWAVRAVPDQASAGTVVLFIALAIGQAAGSAVLGALFREDSPTPAFTAAAVVGILAVLPAVWSRQKTPRRLYAG